MNNSCHMSLMDVQFPLEEGQLDSFQMKAPSLSKLQSITYSTLTADRLAYSMKAHHY